MLTAGVIGWPVAHSKSPLIHRFWLAKLGLDGDYSRFAVHPDNLRDAVRALPALGLRGVNVTVPHKIAVIAHLDRVDPGALRAGAVNTIVVEDGGSLTGFNTDIAGVAAALPGLVAGDEPCIIGNGGAARAALAALDPLKHSVVLMVARDVEKGQALIREFGFASGVSSYEDAGSNITTADAIINATSLGMTGQPPMPASVIDALGGMVAAEVPVFDMVYVPLETPLLAAARRGGHPCIDGLAMLVGQAAAAFELFFGQPAPREHDAELRDLLTR